MITLKTKDGRKTGNAIIFGGGYSKHTGDPVFYIQTDFGNHMTLHWAEIEDMFTIGHVMDYSEWQVSRSRCADDTRIFHESFLHPEV